MHGITTFAKLWRFSQLLLNETFYLTHAKISRVPFAT